MKKSLIIYLINFFVITACAQESKSINSDAINWIPYLTKNNNYIYVDKNLKQQINTAFANAQKFTETGYAIVSDKNRKDAVIDSYGNIIIDYTEESISLNTINNLTLIKKELEYDKKMPVWKWDWNIMGGDIKKTQTYKKTEILVLETNQLILSEDVPYDEEDFNISYHSFDGNHILMNDNLYEIQKIKIKKLKSNIDRALDKDRYIPTSSEKFNIHDIKTKKPILADLVETKKIEVTLNKQLFVLDSINQDRYAPDVPKLLQNLQTKEIYIYPEYDKAFPKEIKNVSAEQLAFLKDVSLVYSVNNSPYFILGRFNYDHSVWAYDWLYIDQEGNVLDKINVKDFFILDRVGYLVWPDKHMILPKNEIKKYNKIGKISSVYNNENLYIINTCNEKNGEKKGLWNIKTNRWELEPIYSSIQSLDSKNNIYALKKEKTEAYILFNLKTLKQIGDKSYDFIYSNGFAHIKKPNNEDLYFYIDIKTGKEYRD